jgi:hypothetical protein
VERRFFLGGLVSVFCLPQVARADDLARFAGRWKYVGGQRQRDRAYAAVDEGTASLNALFRAVARRMIKERTHFPPILTFTFSEENIKVDHSTAVIVAPRTGKLVPWTNEHGDKVKARHKVVRGRIMQQIVDPRGDRINVFRVHEDGEHLTLYVTVRANQMPDDVNYQLSYRRLG